MIRIFQNLQASAFIIAIIIFAFLQLGPVMVLNTKPLLDVGTFSVFFNSVNTLPWLSRLLKWTLVLLGAFMLNSLVLRHEILYKQTALTFLFYLIIGSLLPDFSYLHSFSVINFLGVLILSQIIKIHDNNEANYEIFKASILIGIAGVMHLGYFAAIVFLIFGLTRFKPLNVRIVLIILIGVLFPYAVLWSLQYAFPSINEYITFNNHVVSLNTMSAMHLIVLIPFGLLLLVSAFAWFNNAQRNTVKTRRTIQIILLNVLFVGVLCAIYLGATLNSVELLQMPAAIILAYFFTTSKKPRLRNSLFVLLILCILFTHYASSFYFW